MTTAEKNPLLGESHTDTQLDEVIKKLAANDRAFYDEKKRERREPIFKYDHEGKPIGISHWNTRKVAPEGMKMSEAQLFALDVYIEGRGWIRAGAKAERDYSEN